MVDFLEDYIFGILMDPSCASSQRAQEVTASEDGSRVPLDGPLGACGWAVSEQILAGLAEDVKIIYFQSRLIDFWLIFVKVIYLAY